VSRAWWRWMRGVDEGRERLGVAPNAAKVQWPAPALEESTTGVSFAWPRDTDLTREQIEVAVGDRAAAAPSPTPDAGRPVETTVHDAPRPQEWQDGPTPVFGDGPSMPLRSLSNDNYDRVWVAQGDHVEALGGGDTPQEGAIEYARAVADLLRPTGVPVTGAIVPNAPKVQSTEATLEGSTTDWIERARPGNTPILGGIVGTQDKDGSTVVWSDGPAVYGEGATPGAAMRNYGEGLEDLRILQAALRGEWHKPRNPDALDGKRAIRQQLAACRGECGDGPVGIDCEDWGR